MTSVRNVGQSDFRKFLIFCFQVCRHANFRQRRAYRNPTHQAEIDAPMAGSLNLTYYNLTAIISITMT